MELVRPFPMTSLLEAWGWLREFPASNFDDYGPKNQAEFISEMQSRMTREATWSVVKKGTCCGIIAFLPLTERMGTFHGICFAKGYCSSAEKRAAVRQVIDELFSIGIEKVCASFFVDNQKIDRLFENLGAREEGILHKHTMRDGVPLDMKQVAIFRKEG